MTSRRQRRQPDHHFVSHAYPTGVFDDDFCPVTGESLVGVANSSNIQDADQSIFECDARSDSHISDLSAIASSSSAPSLQSEMNQTGNASMIGPSSSNIFSSLASSNQARGHQTNVPSIIHDQYNTIGQSFYQKKRKRELFQHPFSFLSARFC